MNFRLPFRRWLHTTTARPADSCPDLRPPTWYDLNCPNLTVHGSYNKHLYFYVCSYRNMPWKSKRCSVVSSWEILRNISLCMHICMLRIHAFMYLKEIGSLAFACLESNVCMLLTCTNLTLRRSEVRVGVCFHLRIWISVVIPGALSSHPRLHLITECISSYVHMYILYILYIHTYIHHAFEYRT